MADYMDLSKFFRIRRSSRSQPIIRSKDASITLSPKRVEVVDAHVINQARQIEFEVGPVNKWSKSGQMAIACGSPGI